jgi:hypothetical protein
VLEVYQILPEEGKLYGHYFGMAARFIKNDVWAIVNDKMGCMNELLPKSVVKAVGSKDGFLRETCEECERKFSCDSQYIPVVREELSKLGFRFRSLDYDTFGTPELTFHQDACKVSKVCSDKWKTNTYWPKVKLIPGGKLGEGSSQYTRVLAALVAGVVTKAYINPALDKPGIWEWYGKECPVPQVNESVVRNRCVADCRTCAMYQYISHEDDQYGICTQKTYGIQVNDFCWKIQNWIPGMSEARAEANAMNKPAPAMVARAAKLACPDYQWKTRIIASPTDFHIQNAVWHDWVPALRSVQFIDDLNPRIEGTCAGVHVVLPLHRKAAEVQRQYRIRK